MSYTEDGPRYQEQKLRFFLMQSTHFKSLGHIFLRSSEGIFKREKSKSNAPNFSCFLIPTCPHSFNSSYKPSETSSKPYGNLSEYTLMHWTPCISTHMLWCVVAYQNPCGSMHCVTLYHLLLPYPCTCCMFVCFPLLFTRDMCHLLFIYFPF